jgi:hypothetical protein
MNKRTFLTGVIAGAVVMAIPIAAEPEQEPP